MSRNKNILRVRSTKENIGFSCTLLSVKNKIEVKKGDARFEAFRRHSKRVTYDKDSEKVLLKSHSAGFLIGSPGDFLVEAVNGLYYPTTMAHLRKSIEVLKSKL